LYAGVPPVSACSRNATSGSSATSQNPASEISEILGLSLLGGREHEAVEFQGEKF
jgi:hypothetical protein